MGNLDLVQNLNQAGNLVPLIIEFGVDVGIGQRVNGDEGNIGISTRKFQERGYSLSNGIVPLFIPVNSVHLADDHDESLDAQCSCQHSLFFGLSFLLKSRFKLTLSCRYKQNRNICLACSHNHVGNVVFVPRSIEQGEPSIVQGEHQLGTLYSLPPLSLIGIGIGHEGQLPGLHVGLLGLLLVPGQLLLVDLFELLQDVSRQG